jgi:dipeptidyl aminopeptidase/acylaminoacyl peptidase
MTHGLDDREAPVDHARQFVSAARDAGVTIEPPLHPEDGYRFFNPRNHVRFPETLQRSLEKSLAPAD